jgi:outer membrane protein assembly factor BamB
MHRRLLALAAACLASAAPAQEWNRFRGPAGQGIARGVRLVRAPTDADVRWRVPVGGAGHSSPVLWDGAVHLTREGESPGTREVVAFAAADGAVRWAARCEFEPHPQHEFNSFASSTPAVDASGVYVVWTSGQELVAEAFTHAGERRYRVPIGPFRAQHGSGTSPILIDGALVVANDHDGDDCCLIALDAATGETRWKLPRRGSPDRAGYSCPAVVERDGRPFLLVASTAHGLSLIDPHDGAVAWELDLGLEQRIVSPPCLAGDLVLVAAGSGGGGKECAVARLPPGGDDAKPAVAYRPRRNLAYVPATIAVDGRFFMFTDNGMAQCLAAATGEVVWRERLADTFFGSPVSDGETIWIASRDGTLWSLAAGPEFERLGALELGAPVFATPAIGADRVFVRTATELVCVRTAPE